MIKSSTSRLCSALPSLRRPASAPLQRSFSSRSSPLSSSRPRTLPALLRSSPVTPTNLVNSSQRRSKHADSAPTIPELHPRRALLYVPGSDPRKLKKSIDSPADAVIFDLEDSVAEGQKGAARAAVFDALQASKKGRGLKFVRINAGPMGADDLEVVLKSKHLDGIVIPKVNSAADVQAVDALINSHGLEKTKASLRIIASIESPLALMNLKEIATSSQRLDSLLFASEDYCATSNLLRTSSRHEMAYARSAIVAHAKAYGLQAIDLVCVAYNDFEVLREESREGRELGFDGKQAIHPAQVEIIQSCFSPSEKDIAKAVAILDGYETASKSGRGAYGLDGEEGKVMIDAPMARSVLAKAKAAGLDVPLASKA